MHGPTCVFWANLTPFSLSNSSVRASIYGPRIVPQLHLENVAQEVAEMETALHGTFSGYDIVFPEWEDRVPSAFPVGTEISKVFGDGIAYRGQVVSFDAEHKLYAVEYDDGDAEELTEEAVRSHRATAETALSDTETIEMRPRTEETDAAGAVTAESPPVSAGTGISKEFNGIAYRGQVVSFDPKVSKTPS